MTIELLVKTTACVKYFEYLSLFSAEDMNLVWTHALFRARVREFWGQVVLGTSGVISFVLKGCILSQPTAAVDKHTMTLAFCFHALSYSFLR